MSVSAGRTRLAQSHASYTYVVGATTTDGVGGQKSSGKVCVAPPRFASILIHTISITSHVRCTSARTHLRVIESTAEDIQSPQHIDIIHRACCRSCLVTWPSRQNNVRPRSQDTSLALGQGRRAISGHMKAATASQLGHRHASATSGYPSMTLMPRVNVVSSIAWTQETGSDSSDCRGMDWAPAPADIETTVDGWRGANLGGRDASVVSCGSTQGRFNRADSPSDDATGRGRSQGSLSDLR